MLHVWEARLDAPDWPGPTGLPGAERERAARLAAPRQRRRWIASRWAVRGVLARYLGRDPAEIELRLGECGKPMLAELSLSLRFNLSHSGDLAVVAVSGEREVGVDVERIEPRKNLLTLARRALPTEDAAAVEAAAPEERLAIFHAAWARREAVAKCLGVGIAAPLPDARVAVSQLDLAPGYAAAVAVAGETVPPPRCFDLRPELG